MNWSIPIGTVKGTVIRIHITFLLFLLWIGIAHHAQGGAEAALEGVVFIALLFLCVLLHEFGHVFAARRYGVQTPDITLLPIGGVARLERIPEKPSQELVIALAGPAVNIVIAGILYLLLGGFLPAGSMEVQNAGVDMLARLASVNLFLALFNLIPAFPMDGGRVLRAILAARLGYGRGTQMAASVGQAVAFGLGLLGLFGNPLLIFIALFVYLGAASEAHAVQMREITRGVAVSDAMVTRFESLSPSSVVEDAVQCLIRTTQHEFPVVDGAGRLRGVLTRDDMIRALRERGPDTPVLEVMRTDIPVVRNRGNLEEALRVMQENRLPAVGVTDGEGRLVGLVTPENVGEMMMIQSARPQPARR
ncbi:site-2 protease family protein [Azospirillum sp. SYSU D00513]|uniref:site-2 protease family protein n=1 Tax=Azospirillum sp. SYSU D00513 TaxID=2812561 RepID=UPI001A968F71|nr:site-2 protease family protein [Azospirillum sp. SYSU D00513]